MEFNDTCYTGAHPLAVSKWCVLLDRVAIHPCMHMCHIKSSVLPNILLYAWENRNDDPPTKSADGAILTSVSNCYTMSQHAGSNVTKIAYKWLLWHSIKVIIWCHFHVHSVHGTTTENNTTFKEFYKISSMSDRSQTWYDDYMGQ